MHDVRQFFDEYRVAFASFEREWLTEFFDFPLQVVSGSDDGAVVFVMNRDDWPAVLDGLFDAYRTLAVAGAEPLTFDVRKVSPRVVSASVHWELRRADAGAVYDFTGIYTLVEVDGTLRIVAIAHDELPKLEAALAASASQG